MFFHEKSHLITYKLTFWDPEMGLLRLLRCISKRHFAWKKEHSAPPFPFTGTFLVRGQNSFEAPVFLISTIFFCCFYNFSFCLLHYWDQITYFDSTFVFCPIFAIMTLWGFSCTLPPKSLSFPSSVSISNHKSHQRRAVKCPKLW